MYQVCCPKNNRENEERITLRVFKIIDIRTTRIMLYGFCSFLISARFLLLYKSRRDRSTVCKDHHYAGKLVVADILQTPDLLKGYHQNRYPRHHQSNC